MCLQQMKNNIHCITSSSQFLFTGFVIALCIFYSCQKPSIEKEPIHNQCFRVIVVDSKTKQPVSGAMVRIASNKISNDIISRADGRADFVISSTDTLKELIILRDQYACLWRGLIYFRDSIDYPVYIDHFAYLNLHALNTAPILDGEELSVITPQASINFNSTPNQFRFIGATDKTYTIPVDIGNSFLKCKRYLNRVLDSTFDIPVILSPNDTTYVSINF